MRLLAILCCTFCLTLAACQDEKAGVLQDLQGNTIEIVNDKGIWFVINYWANWCKPCQEEIPALNAFYQAHKDKGGVKVVGVNYDHAPKDMLNPQAMKLGIQFPILSTDPRKTLGITDVDNIPVTFIVAPNGKVVSELPGKQTQESLEKALAAAKNKQ